MPDRDPKSNRPDPDSPESQRPLLESVCRRVQALTVAVVLMAMALFLYTAAVFGEIVDYHGGEALLVGGTAVGTAILGFLFGLGVGWLVRRK
jgi:hypothetical protein